MSAGEQTERDTKDARIDARITGEQKEIIKRAAGMRHLSVSDFVVASALDAAYATIDAHTRWTLNAEQSRALARLLLDPPEPGEGLRKAVERHRTLLGDA